MLKLARALLVTSVTVALGVGAGGCGNHAPGTTFNLGSGGPFHTIVSLQGLVKSGVPMAFNLEGVGCVQGGPSLTVDRVTLHAPTSGLTLTDWGATAARKPFSDLGIFYASKHPLATYGLSKRPWTGTCPHRGEQMAVVLTLKGRAGTTAGIDIHFTNGTTSWVPMGLGLCNHWCPKRLVNKVGDAIDEQRGQ